MTVFNLTEIEKKAYRSTFQDGLWDIFLGLLLLVRFLHEYPQPGQEVLDGQTGN